jgi:hypothetical protein
MFLFLITLFNSAFVLILHVLSLSFVDPNILSNICLYNVHFNIILALTFRNPKRRSLHAVKNKFCSGLSTHATCPNCFIYIDHMFMCDENIFQDTLIDVIDLCKS